MIAAFHTPEKRSRKDDVSPSTPAPPGAMPRVSIPFASLRRRAMACALATVLVGGSALAYVLPQSSVLRRIVAARDEQQLASLRVDGSVTLSGQALRQAAGTLGLPLDRPEAQTEGTFSMKLPGRCRLEAGAAEGRQALVAVQSGGRRKSTGVELTPVTRGLAQACALLGMRASSDAEGRAALESHLRSLGVDAGRTWLARFGGKVVYVLGSRAEGEAQLWVYKDTFQPARLRWTEKDGTAWDVWMMDYASPATGEAFPRIFEVHQNGERQLRFNALRGDTKARLEDALFAVQ
jgi:hypothetical protein